KMSDNNHDKNQADIKKNNEENEKNVLKETEKTSEPIEEAQSLASENSENDDKAQEMLEKYDRESQYRSRIGKWAWVVTFLGVGLTIFHMYSGYYGTLPSQKQGAIHLGTALGLIFL